MTKITIDLPQDASSSVASYLGIAALALLSGVFAVALAYFLRRVMSRRTCTIVASVVSVLPIMGLVLMVGAAYEGADNPIYTLATLLPALVLCLCISLFISAPFAWMVARTRKGGADADIFE